MTSVSHEEFFYEMVCHVIDNTEMVFKDEFGVVSVFFLINHDMPHVLTTSV